MDVLRVRSVLMGIPCIKITADDDLIRYLAGVVADVETPSPADLADALGPFLESQGCCEGSADVLAVCTGLYNTLVSTGMINAPSAAAAAVAAAKPRGAYAELEAEDNAPTTRALAAPVKLGASASDSASLDILWGRDQNKFLQQNTDIDREAQFARLACNDAQFVVHVYASLPHSLLLLQFQACTARRAERGRQGCVRARTVSRGCCRGGRR